VDTCLAIACDGRFEAGYSEDLALKADLNGRVNHCVAVDHESAALIDFPPGGNRAELGAEISKRQTQVALRQLGPK
jgi:hypothetical protein